MKRIGILGGMGPEATVDYYKSIVAHFHESNQSLSAPEIIIYSVDIAELFRLVSERRWTELTDWLAGKLASLKSAGAEFAAISANTPHIVFAQLLAISPLPLISIVEAAVEYAKRKNFQKPGLLGTKFTMQANFFGDRFARESISVAVPSNEEQDFIQEKLVQEIELGIFRDETRKELLTIISRMKERDGIDSVILGCTELPLILQQNQSELPFLNTSAVHVEAICKYCQQGEQN